MQLLQPGKPVVEQPRPVSHWNAVHDTFSHDEPVLQATSQPHD